MATLQSNEVNFNNNNNSSKIDKKEILYKGYFYDITDFIHKHPGGNVIQFYTERGEDATQAIEQFHFRSAKKIELIMKSFKRRVATADEVGLSTTVLTRHEALSKDFKELFEQLVSEGYFAPSIKQVILRFLEPLALVCLGLGLMAQSNSFFVKFFCAIFGGFAFSRFGWLMHEGGHRSLTGNRKVDQFLQDISMCSFCGGSSVWWNSQHNRHHAMPQRLHHDVDLASLPFVAFNEKEVQSKSEFIRFFVKYQGILYWTIDLFFVVIAWKFYIHPRCQLRKKAYLEMFLNIPNYLLMVYLGVGWFFLASYWFSFFLALNFSLSHSHLETTEKPTHWIEYSLTHTANIQPSLGCDWWMGYLNYQIEHHLFPSMPQFRQREICHRVKALAEKHGLPYLVYSYPEACRLAMQNLYEVGKKLDKENFSH